MTVGPPQPTVVLMCGIAGAGKTTYAVGLSREGFRRLSIDQEIWDRFGRFGVDYPPERYAEVSAVAATALEEQLTVLVREGQDVVLDVSCSARVDRDRYKHLVEAAGGRWRLVFLRAGEPVLRRRLAARAHRRDADAAFPITDPLLAAYIAAFQAPNGEGEEVVEVLP